MAGYATIKKTTNTQILTTRKTTHPETLACVCAWSRSLHRCHELYNPVKRQQNGSVDVGLLWSVFGPVFASDQTRCDRLFSGKVRFFTGSTDGDKGVSEALELSC